MKLNENLQICLLAIANRYPESTLDINQEVPGPQSFQAEKCTPLDLMERLQSEAPQLLRAPAQLVVNAQERAIYLVEQPQQTPAFWIRSRERTQKEAIASLRRENAALKAEKRELKTQLLRCSRNLAKTLLTYALSIRWTKNSFSRRFNRLRQPHKPRPSPDF